MSSTRTTQRVIGGVLYSPVPANQIEPGDLIAPSIGLPVSFRVVAVLRRGGSVILTVAGQKRDQIVGLNARVLRAVGARVGGVA